LHFVSLDGMNSAFSSRKSCTCTCMYMYCAQPASVQRLTGCVGLVTIPRWTFPRDATQFLAARFSAGGGCGGAETCGAVLWATPPMRRICSSYSSLLIRKIINLVLLNPSSNARRLHPTFTVTSKTPCNTVWTIVKRLVHKSCLFFRLKSRYTHEKYSTQKVYIKNKAYVNLT